MADRKHPTETAAYWQRLALNSRSLAAKARRCRGASVESIEIHEREAAEYERQAARCASGVNTSAADREILLAVWRELDEGDGSGNAPGHGHREPGIWDEDNGKKSGKACAWCLTWAKFTKLIQQSNAGVDTSAETKEKP